MSPAFLQMLSRPRPDPGGGAAAAYGARLGLALLEKVVQLEGRRRPNPEGKSPSAWAAALERVQQLTVTFLEFQEEDVRAYFHLTAARAAEDGPRLAAAAQDAVACPREIAAQAGEALKLLAWAGEHCRRHLVSDLLVGCEFLGAALQGAHHIAAANLPLVKNEDRRRALAQELRQARQEGQDLYQRVKESLRARQKGVAPVSSFQFPVSS